MLKAPPGPVDARVLEAPPRCFFVGDGCAGEEVRVRVDEETGSTIDETLMDGERDTGWVWVAERSVELI